MKRRGRSRGEGKYQDQTHGQGGFLLCCGVKEVHARKLVYIARGGKPE